jgi:hypothetical protein
MGWYFNKNCRKNYKYALENDDGTVSGAGIAAFHLIVIFPCHVIWNLFMICPEHVDTGNGGLAMVSACCCCFPGSIFMIVTFLILVAPALVAGVAGLIFGIGRLCFTRS